MEFRDDGSFRAMGGRSKRMKVPYLNLDIINELPTPNDSMRGQLRCDPGTTGVEDRIMFCGLLEDGSIGWFNLTGIVIQESDVTLENVVKTLDFLGADFDLTEAPAGEVNIALSSAIVKLDATQTLTNKTLTAPAINDPTIARPIFSGVVEVGPPQQIQFGTMFGTTWTAAAAAGTTASTASSDGGDGCGFIQLVPNGAGIAIGTIVDIAFATNRPDAQYIVQITPHSSASRSLGGVVGPTSRGVGGFSLDTRTALTAGSTYQWGYTVFGY
jgi:hypothetical protein